MLASKRKENKEEKKKQKRREIGEQRTDKRKAGIRQCEANNLLPLQTGFDSHTRLCSRLTLISLPFLAGTFHLQLRLSGLLVTSGR